MESSLKTNSHMPFSPHLRNASRRCSTSQNAWVNPAKGPLFSQSRAHLLQMLISVESSPLWRGKYSRKKPPLNHVFTLAILIHSRGGDEEMYIVETLAKNRRLYPREG